MFNLLDDLFLFGSEAAGRAVVGLTRFASRVYPSTP